MKNNTKKTMFGTPEQKGNVTIYPSVPVEMLKMANEQKLRTAAYVRVSTEQQEGSQDLQKEYFENLIKNNPEYEFAGIYEDDGITATNVEKRKGFLRMIEDCKAGKIDLILTKSVSRFARNIGDLLHYINVLKDLKSPVEIQFESDRVSTFGVMGEMLIMILGIVAQEESRLKSEAITWAIDKLFEQGKFYVPAVFGYTKEKGRDNPLVINEKEAKVVRLCYAMAVSGYSLVEIANTLNTFGIKSKTGKTNWQTSRIASMLSNEKYAGNLTARKTVTPNYKTHKSKKNVGEKDKYDVKEHHAPIVPPLAYDVTLKILKNRRGNISGIPCLKAVPDGILKGFVIVNKNVRGYTLNDYIQVSRSVYEKEEEEEISIFADKASIFDLRNYDTVSALFFEDKSKSLCTIKESKITFNTACRKSLNAEKAEILFHPTKAVFALRAPVDETNFQSVLITKPVCLSAFIPVALEAAEIKQEYQYRIYGTKRTKNGESIMFFDLRNSQIISNEKDDYILPNKYAERYGEGYYENLAACDLHKIDIEGLWQAMQASKPINTLAGQIVELTEFCQENLAEFGLLEK